MAEDEQVDVKKLEKEKEALQAEMDKMIAQVEKTTKSYAAIRKEFDAHELDKKGMEEQQLEDVV